MYACLGQHEKNKPSRAAQRNSLKSFGLVVLSVYKLIDGGAVTDGCSRRQALTPVFCIKKSTQTLILMAIRNILSRMQIVPFLRYFYALSASASTSTVYYRKGKKLLLFPLFWIGADEGTWTPTSVTLDPKSCACYVKKCKKYTFKTVTKIFDPQKKWYNFFCSCMRIFFRGKCMHEKQK